MHHGTGGEVGVAAACDGDGAELLLGGSVVVHVATGDGGEVDGLREPPERHLEVLLEQLARVRLTGAAHHLAPLGRPRHRERVDDVARLSLAQRHRRFVRRGARPHHAAAAIRLPHRVRRAEVRVVGGLIELVAPERHAHDAVDLARVEARVGERPLDGLSRDLCCRAARRARLLGLADTDDGDLAAHVVVAGGEAPVAHRFAVLVSRTPHRSVTWELCASASLRCSLIRRRADVRR